MKDAFDCESQQLRRDYGFGARLPTGVGAEAMERYQYARDEPNASAWVPYALTLASSHRMLAIAYSG